MIHGDKNPKMFGLTTRDNAEKIKKHSFSLTARRKSSEFIGGPTNEETHRELCIPLLWVSPNRICPKRREVGITVSSTVRSVEVTTTKTSTTVTTTVISVTIAKPSSQIHFVLLVLIVLVVELYVTIVLVTVLVMLVVLLLLVLVVMLVLWLLVRLLVLSVSILLVLILCSFLLLLCAHRLHVIHQEMRHVPILGHFFRHLARGWLRLPRVHLFLRPVVRVSPHNVHVSVHLGDGAIFVLLLWWIVCRTQLEVLSVDLVDVVHRTECCSHASECHKRKTWNNLKDRPT